MANANEKFIIIINVDMESRIQKLEQLALRNSKYLNFSRKFFEVFKNTQNLIFIIDAPFQLFSVPYFMLEPTLFHAT